MNQTSLINAPGLLRTAANYLDRLPIAYRHDHLVVDTFDDHGLRLYAGYNVRAHEFLDLGTTLTASKLHAYHIGTSTCLELTGVHIDLRVNIVISGINGDLTAPIPGLGDLDDHVRLPVTIDQIRAFTATPEPKLPFTDDLRAAHVEMAKAMAPHFSGGQS